MEKLKPVGNRLLVTRFEESKENKVGGIHLPDNRKKEKSMVAEVVAVGDPMEDSKPRVKFLVGDKILLSKYGGAEIELNNEEFTVIDFDDVLGIFKEDEA